MKRVLFLIPMILVCQYSIAQNWFPTEVGNKLLQKATVYGVWGNVRHFYLIEIKKDSMINGQRYFLLNSSDYIEGLEYSNEWFRYDQDSQKVYRRVLDTSVVYMDFNLSAGQQFEQYDPISHYTTLRTVFESTIQMFGNTYSVKGFSGDEWSMYMRKWILDFGIEPLGSNDKRMEQILLFSEVDTLYYQYNFYPDFSLFAPTLETNTLNIDFDFWVGHPYNQNNGSVFVDFVDSIYFECFYKSVNDSIYYGRINAHTIYYPNVIRNISFNLNSSLLSSGYSFYYKVIAKDKSLISNYRSKPDSGYYKLVYTPTNVENEKLFPTEFSLSQNYPNPFNPSTSIQYAISSRQFVTLKVYDVLGNEVATLVYEEKSPGSYEVKFNSVETLHATSLPSGVYFYQLKTGDYLEIKKMILLK